MKIKCLCVCRNSNGEAELFPEVVECTQEQYDNGDHYDVAEADAEQNGYEVKLVADENEPLFHQVMDTNGLQDWEFDNCLPIEIFRNVNC